MVRKGIGDSRVALQSSGNHWGKDETCPDAVVAGMEHAFYPDP